MVIEQEFVFPLSFGQQRLWLLHQLEPDLPLYNIPIARRLSGTLNVLALEQGLNEVVRRHETLRTTFKMVDEQTMQVVHPTLIIELPVTDLRLFPPSQRKEEIARLMEEEARRPFDLISGPLIRAQILWIEPEEHILLLTVHHVVFDDWSMGIFYHELQTLYDAYREGKPSSSLPELPIQYADYAAWQRGWHKEIFETQLAYWKQQLKDIPAILELPTDHPRPPIQTYRGSAYSFALAPELLQGLSTLSQDEETTLFMTLLAAFQILLARYTGQYDIAVGSPIINRNRVEIEALIGFFVNTLVFRTNLTGNPTFRELLGRVRRVALDAYTHCDLPFEELVDALQPRRDLSYAPLFQVVFALQNSPSDLKLNGLGVSPIETGSETAKFDLSLTIAVGKETTGVLEYSTDLFDKETIAHMVEHFRTLLEGIVAHPDTLLTDLPLLTAEEHQQLLVEWNDTEVDHSHNACFHHLFEEQVEKSPDAVAVVFEEQTLTYRALNERANQLAHHLQGLGVDSPVAVGICVQRSLDMMIGLLGILKAGGTYVPLDPVYPKERLAFILEDTQAQVLLTHQHLVQELPTDRVHVICLDADWDMIAQESTANPSSAATAQSLAYVIHTSGSTGKPKGVMIPQGALVNFLYSMREQIAITEQDVLLATTSLSFDIAGLELYLPLLVGARVVVAPQEMVVDAKQLAVAIDTCACSIMQMTPTAWRMLVETGWQGNQKLRILCGGEALSLELAHALLIRGESLVNLYGPTETTIWSTFHKVERTDNAIPLGRPITNTQIYVLDATMQLVATGVPGELYIGGAGLARGYFNRPELTAERFVPHPFSKEPGARLYRTGDLVRYRPHRTIEFLGRIDHQVKVHGFRIELGEVEAALRGHQAVRDAVVIVREDVPGDKRLIAYLVIARETVPSINSLHDYLSSRLPEYMIPSVLMVLDTFPLTPNGKVDRKSLPAPDHHRPELDRDYVAPRRPVEELLADIWAQVLGVEQVGIHDKLFDLGGDSIRSVQITARTHLVGLSVTPKQLFQHQTIDKLVDALMAHQSSAEQIKKIESFLHTLNATKKTN